MRRLTELLITYRERQAALASIDFRSPITADKTYGPITSTLSVSVKGFDVPAVVQFAVDEVVTVTPSDVDPDAILDALLVSLPGPWEASGVFLHRHTPVESRIQRSQGLATEVLVRWEGEASWR